MMIFACFLVATPAAACPFCTAVRPSLTQRREAAAVAALGELTAVGKLALVFEVHQVQKGGERLAAGETIEIAVDDAAGPRAAAKPGTLVLLWANAPGKPAGNAALEWSWEILTEVSYAYLARAPGLNVPVAKRLAYFAPFLEHREPLLADDAYLEFGHATYDEVAQVADKLSSGSLRAWLRDPNVPPERKGFYGLALGLPGDDDQRAANAAFLRNEILRPANDFRAGFDGLLGGYLMAAGAPALELIERNFLADPKAAEGDVRHAITALRFYHQYGHEIPDERLKRALRRLLGRPEFAAMVIVDLARWQDWEALRTVAGLFDKREFAEPATDRAIVGYLLAAPGEQGAEALAALRRRAPKRVADAEKALAAFGGPRQDQ
ncbi:MAG TPA: hypothetical protein VMV69_15635 [Pirellulales bacterium]|nr:hypothetical protein [Pirellulales bacterium]